MKILKKNRIFLTKFKRTNFILCCHKCKSGSPDKLFLRTFKITTMTNEKNERNQTGSPKNVKDEKTNPATTPTPDWNKNQENDKKGNQNWDDTKKQSQTNQPNMKPGFDPNKPGQPAAKPTNTSNSPTNTQTPNKDNPSQQTPRK